MIVGIGVDIVRVGRFEKWLDEPRMAKRFFHPEELEYALSRGAGASASLAARFAAKEAFGKALGAGLSGFNLRDVRVRSGYGAPELIVEGEARSLLEAGGGRHLWLSLSHEKEYAVAQVIIEG